ncbi:hypothetical protein T484DRAFT_1770869 [Baffinella frigidus]|nr:hypothetical protein T484DRAFT_1770869 [Cryptophyta sp. CCMP2293]
MHLGKMHGEGEYFCRSGDYYKGTFNEGWNGSLGGRGEVEAGEGWTTFSNGDVWMGGFDAGVPHGPGTMRFADGDVSEVEADHGVFHGEHLFEVGDRVNISSRSAIGVFQGEHLEIGDR